MKPLSEQCAEILARAKSFQQAYKNKRTQNTFRSASFFSADPAKLIPILEAAIEMAEALEFLVNGKMKACAVETSNELIGCILGGSEQNRWAIQVREALSRWNGEDK